MAFSLAFYWLFAFPLQATFSLAEQIGNRRDKEWVIEINSQSIWQIEIKSIAANQIEVSKHESNFDLTIGKIRGKNPRVRQMQLSDT